MNPLRLSWGVILGQLATTASGTPYMRGRDEGSNLTPRASTGSVEIPKPIVAGASQYWEGSDGAWSSFNLRVGTQPQDIRVFPSTTWFYPVLPNPNGCPSYAPSICTRQVGGRGGLFDRSDSLTYIPESRYSMYSEEYLDYFEEGDFGYDTVSLGFQGEDGGVANHSVIGDISGWNLTWLGILGLNPRPTNFSDQNNPQPSWLQILNDTNQIPSLSWAYTAGAKYRGGIGVFGSLTIGGYDSSRFIPSNFNIPFGDDIERDFMVPIRNITSTSLETAVAVESIATTTQTLLSNEESIYALIDSTIPFIYLPRSVCEKFEEKYNLTWDEETELYLLNETQHRKLMDLKPNFTFSIGPHNDPSSPDYSQGVSITLPYSALDLGASFPFIKPSSPLYDVEEYERSNRLIANKTAQSEANDLFSYYFPLRRAANDNQYVLGRAFLQEAYLIANYETREFSVNPNQWDDGIISKQDIVPILSSRYENGTMSGTAERGKSSFSTGAIVGVVIGAVALVAILGLALFFLNRVKKRRKASEYVLAEKDGQPNPRTELDNQQTRHEMDSKAKAVFEMDSPFKTPNSYEIREDRLHELPPGGLSGMEDRNNPAASELPSTNGTMMASEGSRTYDSKSSGTLNEVYEMEASSRWSQVATGASTATENGTYSSYGTDTKSSYPTTSSFRSNPSYSSSNLPPHPPLPPSNPPYAQQQQPQNQYRRPSNPDVTLTPPTPLTPVPRSPLTPLNTTSAAATAMERLRRKNESQFQSQSHLRNQPSPQTHRDLDTIGHDPAPSPTSAGSSPVTSRLPRGRIPNTLSAVYSTASSPPASQYLPRLSTEFSRPVAPQGQGQEPSRRQYPGGGGPGGVVSPESGPQWPLTPPDERAPISPPVESPRVGGAGIGYRGVVQGQGQTTRGRQAQAQGGGRGRRSSRNWFGRRRPSEEQQEEGGIDGRVREGWI
ncbi:acid protease [Aulographum hederae CBS 113979]|uniref:Acid protease n=1 Tax=Aulographum hederae CBS 113979 TaxID=1176131 RepID=A0A6G1H9J0_9PEZI|nr:acid protease [Aulographum hederae CBS 113979]